MAWAPERLLAADEFGGDSLLGLEFGPGQTLQASADLCSFTGVVNGVEHDIKENAGGNRWFPTSPQGLRPCP